jgi:hypothetical protein
MMARLNQAVRRLVSAFAAFACMTGVAASAVLLAPAAVAAPEPSPIPKRWQLDINASPLMTAVVGNRSYFFITYRVTNNSPQDLLFAPAFELSTDEGDLLRSGRDVSVDVTREIMNRLADPLIEDQISIVGTLLRGPENSKWGVVIWPMPQQLLNEVSVYCAGFSGETAPVEIPNPKTGQKEKKLLRKSWMMRFRMPGVLKPGDGAAYDPAENRWIMR